MFPNQSKQFLYLKLMISSTKPKTITSAIEEPQIILNLNHKT